MSAYYAADATAPATGQSTPAPVLIAFHLAQRTRTAMLMVPA